MTLAELKAKIEAEALRRQAARDGFTLEAVTSFLGQGLALPPELAGQAEPPPERLDFAYFKRLHGREFVASCYTLLLGRNADADGMAHYLELLARGEDKAFIVGVIAYSGEGRARHVRVAGLLPRFAFAVVKRVPVAGAILAWLGAWLGAGRREREARAFEEQASARLEALARYVAQSSAQVSMRIEALRSVMENRD